MAPRSTSKGRNQKSSDKFIVDCLYHNLLSPSNEEEYQNNNSNLNNNNNNNNITNSKLSCLVMECGGPNLRQFLNNHNHNTLDIIHRIYILKSVVDALDFLHDHFLVHFDLKPENVVCFSFLNEGHKQGLQKL